MLGCFALGHLVLLKSSDLEESLSQSGCSLPMGGSQQSVITYADHHGEQQITVHLKSIVQQAASNLLVTPFGQQENSPLGMSRGTFPPPFQGMSWVYFHFMAY